MIAVGVDTGGTSTTASFSRDGVFEREYCGAGASATALGFEEAAHRIIATIEALLGSDAPDRIYIGAAGAGRPEISQQLQQTIARRFVQARVHVSDDAHVALRAAVPKGAGIVLIAGTGSIAYAENASGESFRAGGYGYLIGDDGSGYAIGTAALKLLTRAYDGRAIADELCREVESRLDIRDQFALCDFTYRGGPPVASIAALAQPVLALAGNGVRSAQKIVQTAALELADIVKVVAKKAALANSSAPLVLGGGLLRENSMLSFLLETRLQADLPSAEILKRVAAPHRGALAAAELL